MHSWRRCPIGDITDIRQEAILSRAFGSSGTARHRQVTLYKRIESSDLDFWFNFDVRTISVATGVPEPIFQVGLSILFR